MEAQGFELRTWQRKDRWYSLIANLLMRSLGRDMPSPGDDWNTWWYAKFDLYQVLPNRLRNAIDLGCGPYTNIRLIWMNRSIDHVICSDPLARHYVRLKRGWLALAYARGEILLDDHPIEDCPFKNDYFDLVIMINVLDHVQNAFACLSTAARITEPGGYFVLGQDLTDEKDMTSVGEDIGHPIRLHHEDIDILIQRDFKPLLRKLLSREEGRNPSAHYGTYLFIGQKLQVSRERDASLIVSDEPSRYR